MMPWIAKNKLVDKAKNCRPEDRTFQMDVKLAVEEQRLFRDGLFREGRIKKSWPGRVEFDESEHPAWLITRVSRDHGIKPAQLAECLSQNLQIIRISEDGTVVSVKEPPTRHSLMARALTIDAQLLVLLVVGLASPEFIGKHRRLNAYTSSRSDLLRDLMARHAVTVVTPNALTEASNLLGYSK